VKKQDEKAKDIGFAHLKADVLFYKKQ
jgi:hypothetical protein